MILHEEISDKFFLENFFLGYTNTFSVPNYRFENFTISKVHISKVRSNFSACKNKKKERATQTRFQVRDHCQASYLQVLKVAAGKSWRAHAMTCVGMV